MYQKLLVDCPLKLYQVCGEHKNKSSRIILSYKLAEIIFTLNLKTDLQIEGYSDIFLQVLFLKYIFLQWLCLQRRQMEFAVEKQKKNVTLAQHPRSN